jgi:hypothetical protein
MKSRELFREVYISISLNDVDIYIPRCCSTSLPISRNRI